MPKIELLEVRPKRKYVRKATKKDEVENIVQELDNLILEPKETIQEEEICNNFKKMKISKKIVFSNNDFPNIISSNPEPKIPILRIPTPIVKEIPKNQIEFIPLKEYNFDKKVDIYLSYVIEKDMSKSFDKYVFYTRILKSGSGYIECSLTKPSKYFKYKIDEEKSIELKENVTLHIIKYNVEKVKYGKECYENLENHLKRKYDSNIFDYDFCQLKMKNEDITFNKYFIYYDKKYISFDIE